MADSFATDLMVGLSSVQKASPEARFVIGLDCLSLARVTGSQRVLDEQQSIDL